jgi:hypothetical protein
MRVLEDEKYSNSEGGMGNAASGPEGRLKLGRSDNEKLGG